MAKLTKRKIDATPPDPEREIRLWDDDPNGFFLRIKPSGVKTFFLQFSSPEDFKKRRMRIGKYGSDLTLNQARNEAWKIKEHIRNGVDPVLAMGRGKEAAENAKTISEFCDDYIRDARAGLVTYRGRAKKVSTLDIDAGRINRHIKPLLGKNDVRNVTANDVRAFMHDVRLGKTAVTERTKPRGVARVTGGEGTARRTMGLLGSIFSYAIECGIRPDNPCRGLERSPDKARQRALSPNEYNRLGLALDELEFQGRSITAIRAYRALALTGCRKSEIFSLRPDEIDTYQQCLIFEDTKTGPQMRPIGRAGLNILAEVKFDEDAEYIFPAARGDGHLTDTKLFGEACRRANLIGVTLHTLRHSFASVALELEYSEFTIAGILGHRMHSITSRYVHHVDRALVAAADQVASVITARMRGRETERDDVVELRRAR
jgi:integrase